MGFAALVFLSRCALLAALGALTHGQEISDDATMLIELATSPFEILSGITEKYGHHPPLLGLVEGVFILPNLLIFPRFYALRLSLIEVETVCAILYYGVVDRLVTDRATRRWALAAFLVLPTGWMTSTVMAQDEVIAATWLMLVLWLATGRRYWAALLFSGLGVVAAKIFLIVPLMAVVLLLPVGGLLTRGVAGLAPVMVVYGWVAAIARLRHHAPPLVGFSPLPYFGSNAWVFVIERFPDLNPATVNRASMLLGLAASGALALVEYVRRMPFSPMRLARLWAAMLMWFFCLFYHVNPEYYVMVLPFLLITHEGPGDFALLAVLATVHWAVNFFYGIKVAFSGGRGGGRTAFVTAYRAIFPVDPGVMQGIALWTSVVVSLGVAILWILRLLRSSDEGFTRRAQRARRREDEE
jgi:hypothetical protein